MTKTPTVAVQCTWMRTGDAFAWERDGDKHVGMRGWVSVDSGRSSEMGLTRSRENVNGNVLQNKGVETMDGEKASFGGRWSAIVMRAWIQIAVSNSYSTCESPKLMGKAGRTVRS